MLDWTCFHQNHAQHISTSEKLSEELKETGQDVLSVIENLDQKMSDKILVKLANDVVGSIYGIIPDIQEIVIKCNDEKENSGDLKDMVAKFSQYCNEMVQGYHGNSTSSLKQKFQIFIRNILLEAEVLLNLIKKDCHHEFKYELVEDLKKIMYTIQICQARFLIENYNHQELKNMVERVQIEFLQDIVAIKNCSPDVLNALATHIKYNINQVLEMANHLNKAASNYKDIQIQNRLLNSAYFLNKTNTSFLNAKFADTEQARAALRDYCLHGWDTVKCVFEFADICLDNKKDLENLNDIAKYVVSNGIVICKHLGKSVKNDSLFT